MASKRRALVAASDEQADLAARHLDQLEMQASERLETAYPLHQLSPSPQNPRRKSLDRAGVTMEKVRDLAIKPRESLEDWISRQQDFLADLNDPVAYTVWDELFDLAVSLYTSDLLQPVVVKQNGEIIAGERRWTACLLASKSHSRVIIRDIPKDMENLYRLIENIRRSDLTVSEVATSIRQVMSDMTKEECSPFNEQLTMERIKKVMGVGNTQAAYYRAICRLPAGDPILEAILADGYGGLRNAYEDASRRVKEITAAARAGNNAPEANVSPLTKRQPDQEQTQNSAPAKSKSAYKPVFRAPLPDTDCGVKLLGSLATLDGVSDEVAKTLNKAKEMWPAAHDKARKKLLEQALASLISSMNELEQSDADDVGNAVAGAANE